MTDMTTGIKESNHPVLQRFGALLGAHGFRELLQSIFLIILARRNQGEYGDFMLAFNMGYIILAVTDFGLNQHLIRRLPLKKHDPASLLISFTVIKSILFLCAWLCTMVVTLWQGYPGPLTILIMLISIGLGLEAIASSFFSFMQYHGQQSSEGKIRALASTAGFGYGFAALGLRASCISLGFFKLIEAIVNTALSITVISRTIPFKGLFISRTEILEIFRSSRTFILIAVTSILYNKLNALFLYRFGGAEALAQYSSTWSIIEGIAALVSNLILGAVLFPVFARLHIEDKEQLSLLAKNAFNWLLLVSIPLTFLLIAESDRIIETIYGAGYSDAAVLQKFLAFAIPIAFLHNLAAYLMLGSGRERSLLIIYSSGLVLSIALCGTLISASPLAGAAFSILAVKAAVAAATIGFCQRRFGFIEVMPFLEIVTAAAAMICIYLLFRTLIPREIAEFLAIIPPLVVTLRWWRIRNQRGILSS
ncbi:MAG: oligosaccharide flippase family protein [Kiritimatiellae bacterium]|nr:oligosaccharide flippase family protein [Kiritimatiellia bacterium]MDD5521693.1 oligosaccharide flippase family protein [Kiritimatiellia bacterium]